jgi:hypothetical protein
LDQFVSEMRFFGRVSLVSLGVAATLITLMAISPFWTSIPEEVAVSSFTKGTPKEKRKRAKMHHDDDRSKLRSPAIAASDHHAGNNKTVVGAGARPQLILHIGPHKTATSASQCELTYLKETLHDDASFEYLGRVYGECFPNKNKPFTRYTVDTRKLLSCLNRHDPDKRPCNQQKEWKDFQSLLEKLAKSQRNVVLSDEAFSRLAVTDDNLQLFHATLTKHFDVKVVIVYRRYFEWVVSMHNEKYKPLQRRERYQKWPDEKHGEAMRTFPDYYRRVLQGQGIGGYQLAAEKNNLHAVEYLKNVFEKRFEDIRIFNMHQAPQGGPLVTRFMYDILPEAASNKRVQKKLENNNAPMRTNPSICLDYDLLAVAAHEKGLLSSHLKRSQVARAVSIALSKVSSNYTASLPRECLTPEEEAVMLDRSLTFEQRLFPEESSSEATQQHQSAFAKASSNLSFCNIDADAVLKNNAWQKFFRSLRE